MKDSVSVEEILPYSPEDLMEKGEEFLMQVRALINRIKLERDDLSGYYLNDIGFIPYQKKIKVKLYFQGSREDQGNCKVIKLF